MFCCMSRFKRLSRWPYRLCKATENAGDELMQGCAVLSEQTPMGLLGKASRKDPASKTATFHGSNSLVASTNPGVCRIIHCLWNKFHAVLQQVCLEGKDSHRCTHLPDAGKHLV